MSLSYFYIGNRLLGSNHERITTGENPPLSPAITALTDVDNPVYNFDARFIENLQAITNVELGQSVPYISLCSLNLDGSVLDDFNLKFFHKTVDMNQINSSARYPERPELSLKSVRISSDMSAGFIAYTNVTLTLKLHKPDVLTNSTLISLLFPGMPMRLVYGWNSPNDFLNRKEVQMFAVKTYFATFDISGQVDLVIEGMSFSERFSNVLVGDVAEQVTSADIRNPGGDEILSNAQINGLFYSKSQIDQYVTYINALRTRQNDGGLRDIKAIEALAQTFQDVQNRASTRIRQKFKQMSDRLSDLRQSNHNYFKGTTRRRGGATVTAEYVTVHDIISTLCGDTISSLEGTVLPANKDFRIVYGALNENLGVFANKSIADFPIHWDSFRNTLKEQSTNGKPVPTVQSIFSLLINDYIANEGYWRTNFLPGAQDVDIPFVTMNVSSHLNGQQEIVQISLIDMHKNIPMTTQRLRGLNQQLASQDQIEQAVLSSASMPVLRLGNANSFIKSISLSHVNDEGMKAVFINRAVQNSVASPRLPLSPNALLKPINDRAIFLPLKGDMNVLGHVDWKPARFFYLSSGIFFVDAVYKILGFEHEISGEGFSSKISFGYH